MVDKPRSRHSSADPQPTMQEKMAIVQKQRAVFAAAREMQEHPESFVSLAAKVTSLEARANAAEARVEALERRP